MTSMNTAISQAIRVQAAREGISLRKISKEIGMSYTSFWSRLGGERSWEHRPAVPPRQGIAPRQRMDTYLHRGGRAREDRRPDARGIEEHHEYE